MITDPHQPGICDIHCHILPGLDDGPAELEDSLAMAEMAIACGIRVTVATSHASYIEAGGGVSDYRQRLDGFRRALQEHGIPLEVLPGAEYRLLPELPEEAAAGGAVTLNGSRYLLAELDFLQYPVYTASTLFQLRLIGITTIIAHPERQEEIQRRMSLLEGLVERGSLAQVDAESLTGGFGAAAERTAWRILEQGLAHCVASDAHSPTTSRHPGVLGTAMKSIINRYGQELSHHLFRHNPMAIVNNQYPSAVRPPQRRRARWPTGWFRGG